MKKYPIKECLIQLTVREMDACEVVDVSYIAYSCNHFYGVGINHNVNGHTTIRPIQVCIPLAQWVTYVKSYVELGRPKRGASCYSQYLVKNFEKGVDVYPDSSLKDVMLG